MSLGPAQTLFSSQGLPNHPIGLASIHLALQVAPPSPPTQRTSGPPRGGITLGPSPDRSRSRPDFPLLRMPRPPGRLRSPQVSATTPRPRPAHSGRVPSTLCSPGPPSDPTGPAPGPLVTAFPGRRSALPRRRPEAGRPADPQPRTHRAGLCVQPSGWPQPALALMPRLRRRHLPGAKIRPRSAAASQRLLGRQRLRLRPSSSIICMRPWIPSSHLSHIWWNKNHFLNFSE